MKTARPKRSQSKGLSLIEALLGLTLLGFLVLGVSAVFVTAVRSGMASQQLTVETALAQARMEELLAEDLSALIEGGNLDTSVSGYSQSIDFSGNGVREYRVRWQIQNDQPVTDMKTVRVRVEAIQSTIGPRKRVDLSSIRGRDKR